MDQIVKTNKEIDVQGLVVLSGSKSWISKLIKWWTKSMFSHASILLCRVVGDKILKFEAQERGVIPYVFTVSKKRHVEIWHVDADMQIVEEKLSKILDLCGKRYWFENIPGFVISDVAGWFGIEMKNPFDDGYWCSKLCQYYINEITCMEWYDPNKTKPKDIKNLFEEYPHSFKMVGVSEYGQEDVTWL